ncbi:MAG TPA: TonB-dependent receptor [Thermoanaerobaculia bacterium]|nr:TonB-dependent receptor [Thermoanaerobaculia bacterium]
MPDARMRFACGVGLVASLLAWPAAPAAAQEPAEQEEEQERQAGEVAPAPVVDEITVTARKRAEDVQQVPLAISTLDKEELEALTVGGVDVRFLSARVPSLVLESSFGRSFPRFYMRGLGNTDFDLNASQPVSMIYDEVVLENPVLKGMPVWDVERVEVLRGPQGTLFGRNTPAGIVKFDTVRPSQTRDAFLRASYGTFDTVDLRGAAGGPLTDTLSARFSGLFQSRGDWVDNRFTGEDDALEGYTTGAARLQLLWEPNERFSGLLNLHAWDVDGTARVFRANILEPGSNRLVGGFDPEVVFHDGRNQQDIEGQGAVLKLEYDLGMATLTSITGYDTLEMFSRGDIDGGFGAVFAPPSGPGFIPFPSESADGLPDLDQLTQEVRLASHGDGPLGWLVGLYLFDESLRIETFSFNSLAPGNPRDGFAFQEQDTESWALFGSLSYELGERWKLQGGLRYTQDEKDFSAERPDPTFQTPTVAPITRRTDVDLTSWDVSATYAVSEDVNVFGRVATSFRAPSIQGRILFCPDFEGGVNPATNCVSVADEEEVLSTEIGVKSTLFDRRLRLNLTGYRYTVDGQQIVAVGGQFNTATLLNADETEGLGFEADVQIAPTTAWLITLGVSYNDTEIQDPGLVVAPCGGGCTILDPITPAGLVRVDGNTLPHAPKWIANGIVDYRQPVGTGVFVGSVDFAYHDEKHFFLYESEEFRDDAFELGLRLGYLFSDARYEVALFGRNVTDEVIVKNGIDFNNLTGMINDPRVWGLEVVARF